jgi:hypothetical protein
MKYVEVELLDQAGLTRPTGIRRSSVVVDIIEVIEIVGALSDLDAQRILDGSLPSSGTSVDRIAEAVA